jgi:hypothetical protein
MDEYWQQIARELISTRHGNATDPAAAAAWIGRAAAVMAEALRLAGDDSGIEAILYGHG